MTARHLSFANRDPGRVVAPHRVYGCLQLAALLCDVYTITFLKRFRITLATLHFLLLLVVQPTKAGSVDC